MDRLEETMRDTDEGLLFANIVDFDVLYGHRNDVNGYAANLEYFDARLARVLAIVRDSDLLIVSADHGNDPTTPSTDHSREYVPLLVSGQRVRAGRDIGTRPTFADLGQTLAANFGTAALPHGTSFLEQILVEHS
jgi:phosphopentomutase